jgi:hypothetical protein
MPTLFIFGRANDFERLKVHAPLDLADDVLSQHLDRQCIELDRDITPFRDERGAAGVRGLSEVGREFVGLDVTDANPNGAVVG